jgi:transposase InsO family protein
LTGRLRSRLLNFEAIIGVPEIFNTDQGSQFTGQDFTQALKDAGVATPWTYTGKATRLPRRHEHQPD